jgi:hypothetical protein
LVEIASGCKNGVSPKAGLTSLIALAPEVLYHVVRASFVDSEQLEYPSADAAKEMIDS